MRLFLRVAVLGLLTLCGCMPSEQERKLDDTFRFTTHQLHAVSHDLMSSLAYQSAIEGGASPLDYVVAAMPEHNDYSAIVWLGPVAPWTVVIRDGPGQTELIVDAYGESIAKPVQTETIDLQPKPRQGQ